MRRLALLFLVLAGFGVQPALAEQPLTRDLCDQAGMAWDENANVCGGDGPTVQPLTRADCDSAGMQWNDTANVCGSETQNAAASPLLITIDKDTQRMTVTLDGIERHVWPVSTGSPGYSTPSGTYTASSMNKMWYSRQWDNAPMPHAVFFTREGHAIHGTTEVKRLGKPASHGCVRLSPQNAATLFELVAEAGLDNTQIVLAGLTPGGEGRWASSGRSSSGRSRSSYRVEAYEPPRKRGRLFRRWFGAR